MILRLKAWNKTWLMSQRPVIITVLGKEYASPARPKSALG